MNEPAFSARKGMTPGNLTVVALHLTILLGRNEDNQGRVVHYQEDDRCLEDLLQLGQVVHRGLHRAAQFETDPEFSRFLPGFQQAAHWITVW